MKKAGYLGNETMTSLLIDEFINGRKRSLTDYEEEALNDIKEVLVANEMGTQSCNNLFIAIEFNETRTSWNEITLMEDYWWEPDDIGPYSYHTDFGKCCLLTPHLDLGNRPSNMSMGEMFHTLEAPANHGKENGVIALLDVEQFNYQYIKEDGIGLSLTIHDHRDKAMVQFSSQYIHTGMETQVCVTPTLTYTTDFAIKTLTPEQRGCYESHEIELAHLIEENGYRYALQNCLIDQGVESIHWNCRCDPAFGDGTGGAASFLDGCTGQNLKCANDILKIIGSQGYLKENVTKVPEAIDSPDIIGNVTRTDFIHCLPACKHQDNSVSMTTAKFPPNDNFVYKKYFCEVASHVLQMTCRDEFKAFLLNSKYPELCLVLEDHDSYFGNNTSCKHWPQVYLNENSHLNKTLIKELLAYGQDNLALVKIFFQSPYLTKIKRDVEMSLTDFIANTGGLLGLYLGFSIISLFELVFWLLTCFKRAYIET